MILFIFDYFLPVLNNVIFSQSKSLEYLFDVRQYFIRFEERNWVKKFVEIDGSPFNSPNKVYDSAGVESAFYKMGPTDEKNFEIRSKISISPTATVSLQIVLSRTPPPATP